MSTLDLADAIEHELRSELFTNDEDCAGSLHDRARAAIDAASKAP